MTTTQFEHIQAIQVSVHTAELQFSHASAGLALLLGGSLINIARGSCQITLIPCTGSVICTMRRAGYLARTAGHESTGISAAG